MEAHLQKLVEHAEPKPTFNIIVSGTSSRLHTRFTPPLVFPSVPSCYYEMALIKLETYYSFPNIDASNNCVKVRVGKEWTTIKIPVGCYEIEAINIELQRLVVAAGGGEKDKVTLSPSNNMMRCVLEVKERTSTKWISMWGTVFAPCSVSTPSRIHVEGMRVRISSTS